jgi:hypothetical protein
MSRIIKSFTVNHEPFLKMPEASPKWVKKPVLGSGKGNFSRQTK